MYQKMSSVHGLNAFAAMDISVLFITIIVHLICLNDHLILGFTYSGLKIHVKLFIGHCCNLNKFVR